MITHATSTALVLPEHARGGEKRREGPEPGAGGSPHGSLACPYAQAEQLHPAAHTARRRNRRPHTAPACRLSAASRLAPRRSRP